MSTKEKTVPVKNNKAKTNWTSLQLKGFWGTVIVLTAFWFGTYIGTQATLNSQANEAKIKSSAIEEYKSTLKEVQ